MSGGSMTVETRLSIAAALLFAIVAMGCGKEGSEPAKPEPAKSGIAAGETKPADEAKKPAPPAAKPVAAEALADKTGVEPGGVVRSGGPVAVIAEVEGKV